MYGIGVLTGEGTIEALSGCVPLHTTSRTHCIDSAGIAELPGVEEVPILSSL